MNQFLMYDVFASEANTVKGKSLGSHLTKPLRLKFAVPFFNLKRQNVDFFCVNISHLRRYLT